MTSTTIEKNFVSNPILKNWLTVQIKLAGQNTSSEKIDYDKYDVVIEEM